MTHAKGQLRTLHNKFWKVSPSFYREDGKHKEQQQVKELIVPEDRYR